MLHRLCPTVKMLLAKCSGKLPQMLKLMALHSPVASFAVGLHERDLVPGSDVNRYASSHGYVDQGPNISTGHEAGHQKPSPHRHFTQKFCLPT